MIAPAVRRRLQALRHVVIAQHLRHAQLVIGKHAAPPCLLCHTVRLKGAPELRLARTSYRL